MASEILTKRRFVMRLKLKHDFIHFRFHELIGEVRIYSADQSFRTIAHPNINDIRTNVLLTNGCESMAQKVLRNFFVVHNPLKNSVKHVRSVRKDDRLVQIQLFPCLTADRDFLILDFSAFALGIPRDQEIAFKMRVLQFARS